MIQFYYEIVVGVEKLLPRPFILEPRRSFFRYWFPWFYSHLPDKLLVSNMEIAVSMTVHSSLSLLEKLVGFVTPHHI